MFLVFLTFESLIGMPVLVCKHFICLTIKGEKMGLVLAKMGTDTFGKAPSLFTCRNTTDLWTSYSELLEFFNCLAGKVLLSLH